ncbi:MAG: Hsp20/alpha crystallin family protein [Gammaproteobacteria bacterium]|nr:Hsp20/alpha crystallin family protein [Gammaproteobacteria bacterium]
MSEVTQQNRRTADVASREQTSPESARQNVLRPAGDIFEHDGGITLLLDMPGVAKERLDIQTDRNNLTVEGEVKFDMPDDTEPLHADIRSTHYRRSFSLSGEQLDTDAVQASLKDGVLRIDIPKRAELRPRKIEVKTG